MTVSAGLKIGSHDAKASANVTRRCGCMARWIKIPNVESPCVQEAAKFAVEEFNLRYQNSLKYKSTSQGWYLELNANKLKYRLHIEVIDCLQRVLKFEATLTEEKSSAGRVRKFDSLRRI